MKQLLLNRVNAFLVISFLALAQLTISCHKDDNNNNNNTCTTSMKDMAGTYTISKVEVQPTSSSPFIDQTSTFLSDPCMKDNTIVLAQSGTATYNDVGVACNPSMTTTGTWSLNGQQITVNLPQSPINISGGTVNTFDCKNLVATTDYPLLPGSKVKVTLTKQ